MTLREQASERLTKAFDELPYRHALSVPSLLDALQPLFDQVERERDDLRAKVVDLRQRLDAKAGLGDLLAEALISIDNLRAKITQAEADYPEAMMRCFIGWLTVDIPELHAVEVPRLDDSLRRFLSKGTPVALDRG